MVEYIRSAVVALVSCLITLFSPIEDIMLGMVVLLAVNGLFGLLADIINGVGWKTKKAIGFLYQTAVYFVLVMSLFVVGKFIHKHDEAVTCVSMISVITTWVFGINIFRNGRECCPKNSSMYKLFDILHYIVSVQIIEKIPYIENYIREKQKDKEKENENNQ